MKKGSLTLILLVILGLTAVFSVATFASGGNITQRPVTYVACQINPKDILCATPTPIQVTKPKTPPNVVISFPGDPNCKYVPNNPLCKINPAPSATKSAK